MSKKAANKILSDAQGISNALKEGSEKTLRSLLNEAVNQIVNDVDEDEEEDVELQGDSKEEEDVETQENPVEDVNSFEEETEEDPEVTDVDEEGEETEGDEDIDDLEEYRVGDSNEYDITNEDGDTAIKIYNRLDDDDEIYVKKEDDGTYSFEDGDKEYVIELEPENEEFNDDAEVEYELEYETDPEEEVDADTEIELELDDDEPEEIDSDDEDVELEIVDDEDDEEDDEETLSEGELPYTDSYQKNVMPTLNMNTSKKEGTKEWDKVPTGTSKPWAGKGNSKPFEKTIEESAKTVSRQPVRKTTKSALKQIEPENPAQVAKVDSPLVESISKEKYDSLVAEINKYKESNKVLAEGLNAVKQSLYEASVLNINLGKVVKLLVTESMTKDEKQNVIERYSKVTSIKEGNALYESIHNELKKPMKNSTNFDKPISLNETTIYQKPESNPSLDLMNRMDNLKKWYK